MALIKSCLAGAGGGADMSNWTYTNITSSLNASASQNFVVSTTSDLSEYDAIVIAAGFNSSKTGNFTASGCTIVEQLATGFTVESYTYQNKLVLINDVSASGFTLTGSGTGTGGAGVMGFGIKFN